MSSSLVATHYSLDIKFEDFFPVELNRDLPMINMLEFAEGQSRRSVNQLAKHGIEARGLIASYGIGRSHRFSADLVDCIYALESYWEAHVTARAIAHLAGFPAPD